MVSYAWIRRGMVQKRTTLERADLPECRAGECLCLPTEDEIRDRFGCVKEITSRSSNKVFHVVEARDGFHAFVEMNGRYYATSSYRSLAELEDYIY